MEMNHFQHACLRVARDTVRFDPQNLINCALGISGEGGEIADLMKKIAFHGHPLNETNIAKIRAELGDVLWYVATMSHLIGSDLEEIAIGNMHKLQRRYPEGFSTAASLARVDVVGERGAA